MLLRPPSFLPRHHTRAFWICTSCLARTSRTQHSFPPLRRHIARQVLPRTAQTAAFHASSRRPAEGTPNHYHVLELSQAASPAEIKRQFYTLSKKHHPDLNVSDPNASTRFVAISEAYHVLSVPEKRAQYDAQLSHSSRDLHSHPQHPSGSYSSASHFGSRPASGLNKKRSTFRGPPPSFYKSGGYGRHGAKRAEYADYQHAGHQTKQNTSSDSYGGFGEGFGPGQAGQGNAVPHFDDRKHKQTHDTVYEHISARRKKAREGEIPQELDRGGMIANFIIVSGVIGVAAAATKIFSNSTEPGE